ncbi:MAG: HAD-IA family hydrolase [Woeseiaceae bacterium]|nr:HAD-IA family hydrolase [Woeseiaceae bacterium]
MSSQTYDAVLFDLDGTLIDTAPDMVAVLQDMQRDRGLDPVPYAVGRNGVSNGALGLLRLGFPDRKAEFNSPLHLEYLDRYAARVCHESRVFDGLDTLLDRLDHGGRPWGIVTNKPERMTTPLLDGLNLLHRSACIVSGDTLPQRKPDPGPMLHACAIARLDPATTIYVGDAARDVEAGRAAGMATVAVLYGYITAEDDPARWGADAVVVDTDELTQTVLKAVNLAP